MTPHTVGFDLDMTLIDSRPGIKAVYDVLAAESGTFIDSDLVVSRLGPPLELELANWFAADQVADLADRYRAIYGDIAVPLIRALPGAHAALKAVRASGRAIVITAKATPNARMHLDHLRLEVDDVSGFAWREGKAEVLQQQGAGVYVGDHAHDMEAARLAGARGIGVTTGPSSERELYAAGAHTVLPDLTGIAEVLGLPRG